MKELEMRTRSIRFDNTTIEVMYNFIETDVVTV